MYGENIEETDMSACALVSARGERLAAAPPTIPVMNSRRLIAVPEDRRVSYRSNTLEGGWPCPLWVGSGRLRAKSHVRFTPKATLKADSRKT